MAKLRRWRWGIAAAVALASGVWVIWPLAAMAWYGPTSMVLWRQRPHQAVHPVVVANGRAVRALYRELDALPAYVSGCSSPRGQAWDFVQFKRGSHNLRGWMIGRHGCLVLPFGPRGGPTQQGSGAVWRAVQAASAPP